MATAFQVLKTHGSVKERDFQYKCARGSGKDHFDNIIDHEDCKKAPWGAQCPVHTDGRNPHIWGNVYVRHIYALQSNNVENMKIELINRGAFTVGFHIYKDFLSFNFRNIGIYEKVRSNDLKGKHAVALVGYGVKEEIPYWKLQNSWGSKWGDHGYFYMRSGINLCWIESSGLVTAIMDTSDSSTTTPAPSTTITEQTTTSQSTTMEPATLTLTI